MKVFTLLMFSASLLVSAPAMALSSRPDIGEQWFKGKRIYSPATQCVQVTIYNGSGEYMGCLVECSDQSKFYPHDQITELGCGTASPFELDISPSSVSVAD